MSDHETTWNDVKPHFYADSKTIARTALGVLQNDGLTWREDLGSSRDNGWGTLERSLKSAITAAYKTTAEAAPACPYATALDIAMERRYGYLGLSAEVPQDSRTLLETSFVGAYEAPVLITGLLRRMKAAVRVHGVDIDPAELAANSSGLIRQPLNHPQQIAQAFLYSLVPTIHLVPFGNSYAFRREHFLPDELIAKYTKIDVSEPRLEWSMPTEDFTVNAPQLKVFSRTKALKGEVGEVSLDTYPAGTRIGDIVVDKDTISCPGKAVAYFLWRGGVELATQHNLWEVE